MYEMSHIPKSLITSLNTKLRDRQYAKCYVACKPPAAKYQQSKNEKMPVVREVTQLPVFLRPPLGGKRDLVELRESRLIRGLTR